MKMKAILQTRYGTPEDLVLADIEVPVNRQGEVLVQVKAASLSPDVWHVVAGRPWLLRLMGAGLTRPKNPVPGVDVAGVVEATGPGVANLEPGDEVFGMTTSHSWLNGGALAERAAVRADWLAKKPPNVTFEQAASVPTSAWIALLNLRDGSELQPGRRVLVNGAGGSVGSFALQLAKARGARVTGVDSSAKLELMRGLGADEVIDFRAEDFTRRGRRYHLIFDVPGNRSMSYFAPALEPGGHYLPIGHESYGAAGSRIFGLFPHFVGLMLRAYFDRRLQGPRTPAPTRPQMMATTRELLASGQLTPPIDSTYSLSRTREALRHMVENETLGKVVITP